MVHVLARQRRPGVLHMPSITLTDHEFQELPGDFQRFLMAKFYPCLDMPEVEAGQPAEVGEDDDEHVASLTPSVAASILEDLKGRTKQVMRYIATCPADGFLLNDAAAHFDTRPGGLGGCWTGITKVSRRILNNPGVKLIQWTELEDGSWHGRLIFSNWKAFRKAFGIA